ncbi:hypothetical protein GQ457_15G009750 [Hibiscus cannabinus]
MGFEISSCGDGIKLHGGDSDNVLGSSSLVGSILGLHNKDWNMEVNHIGGRINGVADRLEEQGCGLGMDSTLFTMAPDDTACFVAKEQQDSSPATALLPRSSRTLLRLLLCCQGAAGLFSGYCFVAKEQQDSSPATALLPRSSRTLLRLLLRLSICHLIRKDGIGCNIAH